MKNILSLIAVLSFSALMAGCSSSRQFVEKPDVDKPVSDSESIVLLKRESYFPGSARLFNVVANDRLIGEIANDDELVWKTEPNSLECISVSLETNIFDSVVGGAGIKLDSTPLPYKCFHTKPKEILSLTFDVSYPETRMVRSFAFLPLFKEIDKDKSNKFISLGNVASNVESEEVDDLEGLLKGAINKQFKDKLNSSSSKSIDLEILDYKTGNAALRWFASSEKAATLIKVKVTVREDNAVTDEFISRPVVSSGGVFSAGADNYIFDEVAEDIFLYFFEPRYSQE